ncbi:SRPBCC family protein [Amycolatopsis suaedae]|uniref:SRPBCC family protein n=1 Tax=Amycolatopsis suaedae TaxID=2510978 RepID=A0A4Q7J5P1_9PSEU|nr:SRPBCC family protein [Amycolatopsis suaedae]
MKVDVAARVPATPERAWALAADLRRFDAWLILHEDWRSPIPPELTLGTTFTSIVTVKGLRNRITWRVDGYDEPCALSLRGDGVGGVRIAMALGVRPDGDESEVRISAEVTGKPVFGPLGLAVGRALRGDLRKSVGNLSELLR